MEPVLKTGDSERNLGFESLTLRQRITVILIQRNDGYFMLKITNWGAFRERNSPIDRTSLFQIVKRQVIVKMLA